MPGIFIESREYNPEPQSAPAPRDVSYGLPYFPSPVSDPYAQYQSPPTVNVPSVSRVGPTVSVQPRANLDPNLRAGSLLSGGFPTQSNYRAGKGAALQRAFTVEMQERLRRRRRNRFTGYV